MSGRDVVMRAGTGAVSDVDGELVRLREQKEVARLRLEVALAISESLGEFLDDSADQELVVAEVVRRWQALDPVAQAAHQVRGSRFSALAWFAWRFTDAVSDQPFDAVPDSELPTPTRADQIIRRHWHEMVARLRLREHTCGPGADATVADGGQRSLRAGGASPW